MRTQASASTRSESGAGADPPPPLAHRPSSDVPPNELLADRGALSALQHPQQPQPIYPRLVPLTAGDLSVAPVYPIVGIESVASRLIADTARRAVTEVFNTESDNRGLSASIVSTSPAAAVVVLTGLSYVLRRAMDKSQWVLKPEQQACVEDIAYDVANSRMMIYLFDQSAANGPAPPDAASTSASPTDAPAGESIRPGWHSLWVQEAHPPPSGFDNQGLWNTGGVPAAHSCCSVDAAAEPPTDAPDAPVIVAMRPDDPRFVPLAIEFHPQVPADVRIAASMLAAHALAAARQRGAAVSARVTQQSGEGARRGSSAGGGRTGKSNAPYYVLEISGIAKFGCELLDVQRWPRRIARSCVQALRAYFDVGRKAHRIRINCTAGLDKLIDRATSFVTDGSTDGDAAGRVFGFLKMGVSLPDPVQRKRVQSSGGDGDQDAPPKGHEDKRRRT
jgi:hypothetical protein